MSGRQLAQMIARALRFVARLLDPDGVDHLDVYVDTDSPEQIDELAERVRRMVQWARDGQP